MAQLYDIVSLDSIDSTQLEARRRLEAGQADLGLVVLAKEQTEGRGRRGRTWHTLPGHSLAVTVVLPADLVERPSALVLLLAVAGARSLETHGAPRVLIKWPNDLFIGDRKIAGFLAERVRGPQGDRLLFGWGVNLSAPEAALPAPLSAIAGHAGLSSSPQMARQVLRSFLEEVDGVIQAIQVDGARQLRDEFCRRSWLDGREVEVQSAGRTFRAQIQRVTGEGDVILSDGRQLLGEHVDAIVPLSDAR